MAKPFLTYDQQIQTLKDKQLTIQDDTAAKDALRQIGYFSLITGYKSLFKDKTTHYYRNGSTFEEILLLYRFDEDLRELTLRYLLPVERHIRSAWSYAFCRAFGDAQSAYITPQNYQYATAKRQREVDRLIQQHLAPLLNNRTDYPHIEHCKRAHQNVPLWVLLTAVSFGSLSKMYTLSKPQIQSAVSKEFMGVNERSLGQMLQVLTVYRNVCAHGDRLFSYRCARHEIPDLPLHCKLNIPQKGTQYRYGKRDYFAVVLCLRYLLPDSDFLAFKKRLVSLVDRFVGHSRQISEGELLEAMGLPKNWEKITLYKRA